MKDMITTWIWSPTALILLGGIISLIGTFWAAQEQVAVEKASRLRAEQTLAYVQGDHSLKIEHRFDQGKNGIEILTLFVKNMSNLPTYGLTSRVIDVGSYGFETIQSVEDMARKPSAIHEKYIPDIPGNALTQILTLELDGKRQDHVFKVFLSSRKGQSESRITFKRTNSGWIRQEG